MQLFFLLFGALVFVCGWYLGRLHQRQFIKKDVKKLTHDYFSGLNYLLNEQPDKAVGSFLQALNLDDDLIETHLALGNLFRKRGEVDKAIRIHKALLARPTLDIKLKTIADFELGKDFIMAGMLDRAEEIFGDLINRNEHKESSLKYLLDIYQQEKDWDKAIKMAEQLQKIMPSSNLENLLAQFYCQIAVIKLNLGDIKSVQNNLQQALKINPKCIRAIILQADLDFVAKRYKKALLSYKKVYQRDSAYVTEVIDSIAKCYHKLEDERGFEEYLSLCSKKDNNLEISLLFAEHIKKTKGFDSAIRYLSETLKKVPSISGLSKMVSLYKEQQPGLIRTAMQSLEQIIEYMLHQKPKYKCTSCGFSGRVLEWQCPGCKQWETIKPSLDYVY